MSAVLGWVWEFVEQRVVLRDKPRAEPEAAYGEGRPMTGFFSSLTPEQQKAALAYRGEENFGSPEFLRKPR